MLRARVGKVKPDSKIKASHISLFSPFIDGPTLTFLSRAIDIIQELGRGVSQCEITGVVDAETLLLWSLLLAN